MQRVVSGRASDVKPKSNQTCKSQIYPGMQDSSETSDVVRFRDSPIDKKTGSRTEGCRAQDFEVVFGSSQLTSGPWWASLSVNQVWHFRGKVSKARLRWFGYAHRTDNGYISKRMPRLTWNHHAGDWQGDQKGDLWVCRKRTWDYLV